MRDARVEMTEKEMLGWVARNRRMSWLTSPYSHMDDPVRVVGGRVVAYGSVEFDLEGRWIPFQVDESRGEFFWVIDAGSLRGCPIVAEGGFGIKMNRPRKISFEHAPRDVGGLALAGVTSLGGIHEHISKCKSLTIESLLYSDVLGLFLIEGMRCVHLNLRYAYNDVVQIARMRAMVEIVNRHLKSGRVGLVRAQRELIDAGLDEYAEL